MTPSPWKTVHPVGICEYCASESAVLGAEPADSRVALSRFFQRRWSIVEVPRYLFYLFKLLEMDMPKALLFLRYNLFYVLYPLGMLGEVLAIWNALPLIRETHPFSVELPNRWNFVFNYYYLSLFWILLYVPSHRVFVLLMHSGTVYDHEYGEAATKACEC